MHKGETQRQVPPDFERMLAAVRGIKRLLDTDRGLSGALFDLPLARVTWIIA